MFDHASCEVLDELEHELSGIELRVDDAAPAGDPIDDIRRCEELRGRLAAVQARATVRFVSDQKAAQVAAGVPAERVGRSISAQIALARRISPFEAARYVGQVTILTTELAETFAQVESGAVPEWRALLVARETAWLSREHRAAVDAEVAPQLERLGIRKTVDLVKKLAYRLDPHGYLSRLEHAESERHVSIRPAADGMARLTGLLPLAQGIAAYAALRTHASSVAGIGDEDRSRSQLMADTLVERVTGQANAKNVSIEIGVIMTDQTLFNVGDSDDPAAVINGGPIPAELARRMALDPSGESQVLLRRLFTNPTSGQLAAMETQSRLFTENQRKFLIYRDQSCRTPWCDAPIRHADHVLPAESDGPTTIDNGQGLCEACNYAKTAPGWRQQMVGDEIVTVTPTGHRYRSSPPGLPGNLTSTAAA